MVNADGHVLCECGCGHIASHHHNVKDEEHGLWCLHLLRLGALTSNHRTCVRLIKVRDIKPVESYEEMPLAY